jgi:hypothetical protein
VDVPVTLYINFDSCDGFIYYSRAVCILGFFCIPFFIVIFGLLIVLCWSKCVANYLHSVIYASYSPVLSYFCMNFYFIFIVNVCVCACVFFLVAVLCVGILSYE